MKTETLLSLELLKNTKFCLIDYLLEQGNEWKTFRRLSARETQQLFSEHWTTCREMWIFKHELQRGQASMNDTCIYQPIPGNTLYLIYPCLITQSLCSSINIFCALLLFQSLYWTVGMKKLII